MKYDVIIVGGGIVGLATAWSLLARFPGWRLLVLEKEASLAAHQTGRNSGVIHSGLYYKPGSFKARLCKAGNASMLSFCRQHGIEHQVCGKVVVAVDTTELPGLEKLYRRGLENGLPVRQLTLDELKEIEPNCAGIAALHLASTGITDYRAVVWRLAETASMKWSAV